MNILYEGFYFIKGKFMSTIFTKIINKEIPADVVFENDDILAFKDINPKAPVHILIIPKIEIPTINDLEEKTRFNNR